MTTQELEVKHKALGSKIVSVRSLHLDKVWVIVEGNADRKC